MSGFLEEYALPPPDGEGGGADDADASGDGAEDAAKGSKKKKGREGPPTLTGEDFGTEVCRGGGGGGGFGRIQPSCPACQVLKSQNAWMVLYRDGEAGAPDDWAAVAAKADGMISAGEVDCAATPKLCDSGVTLPFIKVFGFGLDEKDDIMAINTFKADQVGSNGISERTAVV